MEITERDCQFGSWKISQTFGTGPSPIGHGGGGHGDRFPGWTRLERYTTMMPFAPCKADAREHPDVGDNGGAS